MASEHKEPSNKALRQRLDAITKSYKGETVGKQILAIAKLGSEFPHRITVINEAVPGEPETFRFTCFQFALDLRGSHSVDAIASRQPNGSPLYPGPEFVAYLIDDLLEIVHPKQGSAGDLVVYANCGSIKHAGIIVAPGVVLSKWGLGHLWIHGTLEVPSRYGSEVRYFQGSSRHELVRAFLEFVAKTCPGSESAV